MTSGVLMLADAGATLAWQEPVSAFFAAQAQGTLNNELSKDRSVVASDERKVAAVRNETARLKQLAIFARHRSRKGHAVGKIELPTLGRHYAVVQGTDEDSLRKGPGHYPATSFPGE